MPGSGGAVTRAAPLYSPGPAGAMSPETATGRPSTTACSADPAGGSPALRSVQSSGTTAPGAAVVGPGAVAVEPVKEKVGCAALSGIRRVPMPSARPSSATPATPD